MLPSWRRQHPTKNTMADPTQASLIGKAYAALPTVIPGFSPRAQQHQMIQRAYKHFTRDTIGIVEAPTGTGKSMSYLIPAIICATLQNRTLVVSTATAGLQDQLASKDLPGAIAAIESVSHEGVRIKGVKVAIAKGRERHVCPVKLDDVSANQDMFVDEEHDTARVAELREMFDRREWDGVRDSLAEAVPVKLWRKISNTADSCSGKQCPQFDVCPHYINQERIREATVIITNHDFLLTCVSNVPNSPLVSDRAIYVFDEAHHLGEKIISAFAHKLDFSKYWNDEVHSILPMVGPEREQLDFANESIKGIWSACDLAMKRLIGQGYLFRYPKGEVDEQFRSLLGDLNREIKGMRGILATAREGLRKREASSRNMAVAAIGDMRLGKLLTEADSANACLDAFCSDQMLARWVQNHSTGVELCCSPFDAAQMARQSLWPVIKTALLTSATISSLGGFDPTLRALGLPMDTATLKLSSPFDYSRAKMTVPKMAVDGNDPNHSKRVKAYLRGNVLSSPAHRGVLVYFTSRKLMTACYEALEPDERAFVLMQGQTQTTKLLDQHKARIDAGQRSIIFGMDTMGEGIDLPGEYCTRVVITKLPFPSMDDPVTATHGELLKDKGLDPFHLLVLPKAGLKLAQICGRLMRRADDRGDVMVLDKRMSTKRYGLQMLRSTCFMSFAST